jgi:hypothetical protein
MNVNNCSSLSQLSLECPRLSALMTDSCIQLKPELLEELQLICPLLSASPTKFQQALKQGIV